MTTKKITRSCQTKRGVERTVFSHEPVAEHFLDEAQFGIGDVFFVERPEE